MKAIIVMGVAGSGKTSVARKLAAANSWAYVEGDDFHPSANLHKMREGIPLDDADRQSWLRTLCAEMRKHPNGCVLACSALKLSYRDIFRQDLPELRFVYLHIPLHEARRRVAERSGHFYPPSLVDSQFDTLEDPSQEIDVVHIDAMGPTGSMLHVVQLALDQSYNY
jgi:gluconokinase